MKILQGAGQGHRVEKVIPKYILDLTQIWASSLFRPNK